MTALLRLLMFLLLPLTRKRSNSSTSDGSSASSQIRTARSSFQPAKRQRTSPEGSGSGGGNGGGGRKTPAELREDAEKIAEGFRHGRTEAQANRAYNGKTVVTVQDANGNRYYTVSSNNTTPEVRRIAAELGYTRINGGQYTAGPSADFPNGQWHAEHIAINATHGDAPGRPTPPIEIAPHRKPCDSYNNPRNQGCGGRAGADPDVTLVGWP